jgi:hypothetical protein
MSTFRDMPDGDEIVVRCSFPVASFRWTVRRSVMSNVSSRSSSRKSIRLRRLLCIGGRSANITSLRSVAQIIHNSPESVADGIRDAGLDPRHSAWRSLGGGSTSAERRIRTTRPGSKAPAGVPRIWHFNTTRGHWKQGGSERAPSPDEWLTPEHCSSKYGLFSGAVVWKQS